MKQDNEMQFPQFSSIKVSQKDKLVESPVKQKSQSQKLVKSPVKQKSQSQNKRDLIKKINKFKTQENRHNSQSDQLRCFICHQYYLKPVTTNCGHSFCDFCLQEYFLFSKECPICQKNIRGSLLTYNNALNEFINGFIRTKHKQYVEYYQQRLEKYKVWKVEDKPLSSNFRAGLAVDIRDENYVWCKGLIVRVISKIGEPIKFLKIQYKTQNMQIKEEQLKWTNQRVAPAGFYTSRKQIPKYVDELNQQKNNK